MAERSYDATDLVLQSRLQQLLGHARGQAESAESPVVAEAAAKWIETWENLVDLEQDLRSRLYGLIELYQMPLPSHGPMCGFFSQSDDPDIPGGAETVWGCGKDAGDGPLFFFVPVQGGAVRVAVCEEHADYLRALEMARRADGMRERFEKITAAHGEKSALGYHVISGELLIDSMRRCGAGESPDMVYAELYANSQREKADGVDSNPDNDEGGDRDA